MDFDFEATFGEDYLYFYAESTDDGHSDDDAAEIIGRLELPAGARVLDAPCGHGRISRRLAAAGLDVTGVDASLQSISMARAEPVAPATTATTSAARSWPSSTGCCAPGAPC
jgi:cyclopropane fatty-acyl-phospholipid synthase-like methyltransferase